MTKFYFLFLFFLVYSFSFSIKNYDSKGNKISEKSYRNGELEYEYKYDSKEKELTYIKYSKGKIIKKEIISTSD